MKALHDDDADTGSLLLSRLIRVLLYHPWTAVRCVSDSASGGFIVSSNTNISPPQPYKRTSDGGRPPQSLPGGLKITDRILRKPRTRKDA